VELDRQAGARGPLLRLGDHGPAVVDADHTAAGAYQPRHVAGVVAGAAALPVHLLPAWRPPDEPPAGQHRPQCLVESVQAG
jgi:hypothetical protein